MDIEKLLNDWKRDGQIDENHLDAASINCALLHGKYLELFSIARMRLKKKELEMAILRKDMWLYYNGKMTQPEMDKYGLTYDPFKGLAKPIKSDMTHIYDSDPLIQACVMQLEVLKVYTETAREILDTLKWRSQTIKNILSHRQFIAGN